MYGKTQIATPPLVSTTVHVGTAVRQLPLALPAAEDSGGSVTAEIVTSRENCRYYGTGI